MEPDIIDNDRGVLRVEGLGKCYRVFNSPRSRLRSLLTGKGPDANHWALSEVTFELSRGHCLGIVGDNGAGKSTLLKLITGTVRPTTGRVVRVGRLTAILELGAGFHPEFSGRDNLYFAGSIIGITEKDMAQLEESIVEFSELGDAIKRPIKTYSSGMVVRLAFAMITAVEPDILVIDEALAVGDQSFQKKCTERIERFRKNGCTILFCSHNQYHIRRLCDIALWLDGGRVRMFGDTENVLSAYETESRLAEAAVRSCREDSMGGDLTKFGSSSIGRMARILSLEIADLSEGEPPRLLAADLRITVEAVTTGDEQPHFAIMLEQAHGVGITVAATLYDGAQANSIGRDTWQATVTFEKLPLHSGDYVVSVYMFDTEGLVVYDEWYQCKIFRWVYPSKTVGLVDLPHSWS